jgi:Xaa-Pro aminopeptidase
VVTAPLRAVKDDAEVAALARAAAGADRVATELVEGAIPLVGRTEAEVSADIGRRLIAEGHDHVNFAIVGSGPNSASPHHDAGDRVVGPGEPVVCDFGGTMAGYCSDITRTVFTGEPPAEFAELYAVLREAQAAAVAAAVIGTPCEEVDAVARRMITAAGYGRHFIHRTGHGIGMAEHEDPYIVGGNGQPLVAGHAFSVEPGIYLAGHYGARIEDIVVAEAAGPRPLNFVDHALAVVDG